MDVHITYETLFDLLRKERSLEELQELDPKFWIYVVQYLRDRNEFFKSSSSIEQEKTRLQLQNIKRIVKEIYDRREQKVIQLAINVVKTESASFVDTRRLLAEEKYLYDQVISLLTNFKNDVLLQINSCDFPSIEGVSMTSEMIAKDDDDETEKRTHSFSDSPSSKSSSDAVSSTDSNDHTDVSTSPSSASEKPLPSADGILVKFTVAVPKFLGKQKEIFGPYDAGTIISLPQNIATILLKKGKVEKVMA